MYKSTGLWGSAILKNVTVTAICSSSSEQVIIGWPFHYNTSYIVYDHKISQIQSAKPNTETYFHEDMFSEKKKDLRFNAH